MFFCATLLVGLVLALVASIVIDNIYHAIVERRWSPTMVAAMVGTICVVGIAMAP